MIMKFYFLLSVCEFTLPFCVCGPGGGGRRRQLITNL